MIETPYLFFALLMIPTRYFVIAGFFYFLFYYIKKEGWIHLKIQKEFPSSSLIKTEIFYSFITMIIFSIVALMIFNMYWAGHTQLYQEMDNYGMPYFIFSTFLVMMIHDLYFYLTHKMMHHKKIYPIVHQVHHISLNPTPWAAFSFHPIEAFIQIAWIPIVIMIIPIHFLSIAIWVMYMMMFNVIGHLGYEFFPKNFINSAFGKIFFSSTFHNMHHKRNNCNYGLYFIFWDKIFGTIHDEYETTYEQVKLNAGE